MSNIADVAKAAQVSVATVSRAMRGLDRVSPRTRARILRVAAELDYIASPTAASLASGRTRVIAVVVPFLTRWYFATLVSSIEKTLRTLNHHVMLIDLERDTSDARLFLTADMLWKRADGLITLNIQFTPAETDLLNRVELPLVSVGTLVPGHPLVTIDEAEAVRLATRHLVDLGHRQIAYVGVVPAHVPHILTPELREESFRREVGKAGLRLPPEWVLDADWTAMAAARAVQPLLGSSARPTAVVAASDEMAIGILESARGVGLRVPEDLSVVGIDDYLLAEVLGVTTVRQDVVAQGRRAAQLLLDALLGDVPLETGRTTVPVELVVRRTTAPPPAHQDI